MTSQVQAHCIKLAVKRGDIVLAVKLAIMANLESGYTGTSRGFFIGNAEAEAQSVGINRQQFAGALSVLTQRGEYEPSSDPDYRGKFGYLIVKVEADESND